MMVFFGTRLGVIFTWQKFSGTWEFDFKLSHRQSIVSWNDLQCYYACIIWVYLWCGIASNVIISVNNKKKLCGPLLWVGFNCLKTAEPLWGESLLFTTQFPEVPGTNLINLEKLKGWVDLGVTQWFWVQDPWIGNPVR